jgi:site-specific recombinase XerD
VTVQSVVRLTQESVYSVIQTFLRRKKLDSVKTAEEYEKDIRQFFMYMRGKNIEHLTESDLVVRNIDVLSYQSYLKDRYSGKTVNRKISSIRSLYKMLAANDYEVRAEWFLVKTVDESDSQSYGMLVWEEVSQMMELAKGLKQGEMKSLLIELAVVTGFRLKSLLSLAWNSFSIKDGVHVITVVGKGKTKDEKAIQDDLYERLKLHCGNEKLFTFSERTARYTIEKLVDMMGLDKKRRICFHSLKKASLYEAYLKSRGDILTVAKHGSHSSFATTQKYYLQFKQNYSQMISLAIGQDIDLSVLEQLDKEQLLKIIKNSSRGTQLELLDLAKNAD